MTPKEINEAVRGHADRENVASDALQMIADRAMGDLCGPVCKMMAGEELSDDERRIVAAFALSGFNAACCAYARLHNIKPEKGE